MEKGLWSTKGRIARGKFWPRCIVTALAWVIAIVVCKQNAQIGVSFMTIIVTVLIQAACLAFVIIQGAKRMHDVNKDAWIFFIPIYGLVSALASGTPGANRFGESPDFAKVKVGKKPQVAKTRPPGSRICQRCKAWRKPGTTRCWECDDATAFADCANDD